MAAEVSSRMRLLAVHDFLGRAAADDSSSLLSSFGTDVYNMVCTFYHIHVVLHDKYGMSPADESVEGVHEPSYVMEMKARGRFVKDEERGLLTLLGNEISQFHALVLSS